MNWTTRMIASLTTKAEYHWNRMHAAKQKGMPIAAEFQKKEYDRHHKAISYLKSR